MHANPVIDADRYIDALYQQSDAADREESAESEAVNQMTQAIRKASRAGLLTPANVRQVLETLACEMKLSGFCDGDIEMTETLAESIG